MIMSPVPKPSKNDETQTSGNRKNSTTKPPDQPTNCPRCNSPNTKFCYYNNYSLTQPRHFCKTCRRYWTKGGALRNVPIGGGCRKNKKSRSTTKHSGESETSSRFNFLNGLPPAMDFQLSKLHSSTNTCVSFTQFPSFGDISISAPNLSNLLSKPKFNLDPVQNCGSSSVEFDFPLMGSLNVNNNLASSIESLSSINQDLHLKMQQQRLGFVFGGENISGMENLNSNNNNGDNIDEKGEPILFENLEICKQNGTNTGLGNGNLETEWYFDNCYGTMNVNGRGGSDNQSNWSNGIQAWSNGGNFNNCLP